MRPSYPWPRLDSTKRGAVVGQLLTLSSASRSSGKSLVNQLAHNPRYSKRQKLTIMLCSYGAGQKHLSKYGISKRNAKRLMAHFYNKQSKGATK